MSKAPVRIDDTVAAHAGRAGDVPAGYKRTDAGVIPKEWDATLLGDIFVFKNGLNKAARFFGSGTPIVNYMDVFERPGIRSKDLSGRVSLSPKEIENFEVQLGDVFFTRTSETVEDVGVASVMLDESRDTVFSGFVLRARPSNSRLDNRYKQYCFSSREIRSQIVSKATYTTRALTNGKTLSAVWIAVPPKHEQRAIADALSDIDGLLESLDALIAKKRAIKQTTMQQLVSGKTRIPSFNEEWETKQVSEFGDIVTGATPRTDVDAFWGDRYPWITPTDISFQRDMTSSERMITQEGLNSIRSVPANSVLVTCIASIGKNAILKTKGSCNQQINAVVPNAAHNPEFLYYLFELNTRHLLHKAGITATRILSKRLFSGLSFKVPFVDEQRAIATVLSNMDSEIVSLEARREKTSTIKQGMMQQLLTGRVRLV